MQPRNEGATAGNARTESTLDLQTYRTAATQITSTNSYDSILGGAENTTEAGYGLIGGGQNNKIDYLNISGRSPYSFIGGGRDHLISDFHYQTIGGGFSHYNRGTTATIVGGNNHTNWYGCNWSFIGGGQNNYNNGGYDTIAGGYNNHIQSSYSFIGGGQDNYANTYAAVFGDDCRTYNLGLAFGLETSGIDAGISHASGQFATRGDAKTEVWTWRRAVVHVVDTWYDLNSSGGNFGPTTTTDTIYHLFIQLVGQTSGAAKRWAYNIEGVILNDNSLASVLTQSITTLYESDASYEVQLAVWTGVGDYMRLQVRTTSATDTVRWFARVQAVILEQ